MEHRTRAGTIAPRLLMLAAVLFCLFGFAVPEGSGGTAAAPSAVVGLLTTDVAAGAADTAHAAHEPADDPSLASVASVGWADAGHAAHGHGAGHGEHSVNCMPSASSSPIAAAPAPDLAPAVTVVALALPRSAAVFIPAVLPRPPDLRSLCVQRV
ncbi:MAG: hypothetical protein ACT4QF_02560 [Sporichthyaceae bacterium]